MMHINRMNYGQAVICQKILYLIKIILKISLASMFQHVDRNNLLKYAALVAVIAQMIADTIFKPAGGGPCAGIFQLMA